MNLEACLHRVVKCSEQNAGKGVCNSPVDTIPCCGSIVDAKKYFYGVHDPNNGMWRHYYTKNIMDVQTVHNYLINVKKGIK